MVDKFPILAFIIVFISILIDLWKLYKNSNLRFNKNLFLKLLLIIACLNFLLIIREFSLFFNEVYKASILNQLERQSILFELNNINPFELIPRQNPIESSDNFRPYYNIGFYECFFSSTFFFLFSGIGLLKKNKFIWISLVVKSIILFLLLIEVFSYNSAISLLPFSNKMVNFFGISIGFSLSSFLILGNSIEFKSGKKGNYNGYESIIYIRKEFQNSIKQYLSFFPEYVLRSKGVNVNFEFEEQEDALKIILDKSNTVNIKEIVEWFNEYIDFAKNNNSNFIINFEKKVSPVEADLLILDLKNQIAHLNNSLEIASVRINLLLEENKFFKELAMNFSKGIKHNVLKKDVELQEVIGFIKNDKIDLAIETLEQIIEMKYEFFYDEIILISSRFIDLQRNFRMGIIDYKVHRFEKNNIANSILALIKRIKKGKGN
jgi:hypothetical protein